MVIIESHSFHHVRVDACEIIAFTRKVIGSMCRAFTHAAAVMSGFASVGVSDVRLNRNPHVIEQFSLGITVQHLYSEACASYKCRYSRLE
jgi:hypothetical protein